ncbi:MAG TPA: DNA-processing protein DprA [Actinoplanes sp.]|nr:DNA-processing protein DprA [Actinoplanes sp.]
MTPGTGADRPHAGDEDRLARIALTWLTEPGDRAVYGMVRAYGAEATLDRLLRGDVSESALRAAVLSRVSAGDPRRFAVAALQRALRLGARVVVPTDTEWPDTVDALATLELGKPGRVDRNTRPPLCLWARGPLSLKDSLDNSVAVVGARAATGYGTHVAADIAYGLAERGWTVVSGGAYGIDAAAHRAALAAAGPTVAVLACGVDRPYPMGNAALFEEVGERGLLISEWPPGAEPLRHRFLIRNRVIAAATTGTVLIEASARSGARQTMGRVLELGRHAMVVPGPVTSAMSVGCHELLRDDRRAQLVTGLPHVLDLIGRIGVDLAPQVRGPDHRRDALDEESALVLEAVPGRGVIGPEQLIARAGLPLRVVLRRLSLLESTGLLIRRDGGFALPPQPDAAAPAQPSAPGRQ